MVRPRPTVRSAAAVLAAGALAACAVGPNYHRPTAPTPPAFKEANGWVPAQPSDAADRRDWWTVFDDPTLNDLEKQVEVSNQNLAAAEAAYRAAHALVAEQRASLFPAVTLNGSAADTHTGGVGTSQSYRLSLGASWEPDIWGKIRRTVENARAGAQVSAADLASARLSAQTELAADYILLRQLDQQKRMDDATVDGYTRSLTITQNKYRAGIVTRSDVASAQTQLLTAQANDADLEQQRAKTEHAIALLVGKPPADLTIAPAPWSLAPPQIPASLPATLLQRRPDIAAAERQAAAASANIGVQTAGYFPALSLTGSAGGAAGELSQLFAASSSFWTLGASVAQTVFDAGATHARVSQARATYDQSVAQYRQTVLTAFGQVEDDLAAQRVLAGESQLRRQAVAAAAENLRVVSNAYKAGQVDYTTVVVAQASLLSAQNTELQMEGSRLTTAVDLIAALGGGWSDAQLPKD
ncbi:MAG: efflux transporter outer membrane subunit [Caulobacterales bacterium]